MIRRCNRGAAAKAKAVLAYYAAAIIVLRGAEHSVSGFSPAPLPPPPPAFPAARISLGGSGGHRHSKSNNNNNNSHYYRPLSRIIISSSKIDVADDEPCIVGENVVASCDLPSAASAAVTVTVADGDDYDDDYDDDSIRRRALAPVPPKTKTPQNKLSASLNLGKCICGAGSFALPHVFLEEGVLGGTLAMAACASLASYTMASINDSRYLVAALEDYDGEVATKTKRNTNTNTKTPPPPASYVELARMSLGPAASTLVFVLTMAASLGVCSTYIVFVGQTLASLSADVSSSNIVRAIAPDVDEKSWELISALAVYPLSLVRNYGIFAFTSALGVAAVLGGMVVTLAYGILVDPGGGMSESLSAVSSLRMWPESYSSAFGGSFGTIAYLFCVNFLTFPIINSMGDDGARRDYGGAVSSAVAAIWTANAVFAIVCLGFYGEGTQDLVLQNLDNGPYLSALKVLLCVDLLFTFPVVFSSGRQILENALIDDDEEGEDEGSTIGLALSRAAVTGGAVAACFGLSQVGGFGVVANLVGGVAQGTLAFIVPPAMAVSLSRRRKDGENGRDYGNGDDADGDGGSYDYAAEAPQWLIGGFGAAVVSSVTYFTLAEALR